MIFHHGYPSSDYPRRCSPANQAFRLAINTWPIWLIKFLRVASGELSILARLNRGLHFFDDGVIWNLGNGLANRMMPQLAVVFVAASLLIGRAS